MSNPLPITTPTASVPQMDWQQVALNGGPPCFALDHERPDRYCGRAQRWQGHDYDHKFVSLEHLLSETRARALQEAVRIVDTAGKEWGDRAHARKSKAYSAYAIAALDIQGRLNAAKDLKP